LPGNNGQWQFGFWREKLEDKTNGWFDERYNILTNPAQCLLINVGTGEDLIIRALAEMCAEVVGYNGKFVQDTSKPDGTMRKVLDVSKIRNQGWVPKVDLKEGIALAYNSYLEGLSL